MSTAMLKRYVVEIVGAPRGNEVAMDFDDLEKAKTYWEGERTVGNQRRRLRVVDRDTGTIVFPESPP